MNNWNAQNYNLTEKDLDAVVWRYLTFPKFVSMMSYEALWFCRLSYLSDKFEGAMPRKAVEISNKEHARWKATFASPEHHRQLDEMSERNVCDGRSLTAVNCWFIGEEENLRMWEEYVGATEGVAIRSTVGQVWKSTYLDSRFSFIGKVNYVNLEEHQMESYEAGQAHHRAFLKSQKEFKHEQELRFQTMNIRTLACLDPSGQPLTPNDLVGTGMNNFDEAGLNVRVKLDTLFDTIVTAPNASAWFFNLIKRLQVNFGIKCVLKRSDFDSRPSVSVS